MCVCVNVFVSGRVRWGQGINLLIWVCSQPAASTTTFLTVFHPHSQKQAHSISVFFLKIFLTFSSILSLSNPQFIFLSSYFCSVFLHIFFHGCSLPISPSFSSFLGDTIERYWQSMISQPLPITTVLTRQYAAFPHLVNIYSPSNQNWNKIVNIIFRPSNLRLSILVSKHRGEQQWIHFLQSL